MWYKVKKIYQWSNLVRPKWKPWSNTIAYYKFDWNLNDSSGNNRNLSWGNVWTFWTASWWWTYAIFNQSAYINKLDSIPFNSNWYTVSMWYNYNQNTTSQRIAMDYANGNTYFPRLRQDSDGKTYIWVSWFNTDYILNSVWAWHNIVITVVGNSITLYIDWISVKTGTSSSINTNYSLILGRDYNQTWTTYTSRNYLGETILESVWWSAQEIADYYNLTKSNYWL